MAKPINPYQGPAPAAMAQMGAGILEAGVATGANVARTLQGSYESMGKGIASGITAAADAYKQYKNTQSEVKASQKSYETMKSFLPEEVRNKFDQEIESMNNSDTTSLQDKAAFWNQAKSFIGSSVGQAFQMNKQKAELDAAAARMATSEAGATGRTAAQIAAGKEEMAMRLLYGSGSGGNTSFGGAPGRSSNQFAPQNLTLPDYGPYGQQIPIR